MSTLLNKKDIEIFELFEATSRLLKFLFSGSTTFRQALNSE